MLKLLLPLALSLPAWAQILQPIFADSHHSGGSGATIAFVSADSALGNSVNNIVITRTINSGNLVYVKANFDAGGSGCNGHTIAAITRNGGGSIVDTLTAIGSMIDHPYECSARFYVENSHAAVDVRVNYDTALVGTITVLQFSGVALSGSLDTSAAVGFAATGTSVASEMFSTNQANEISIAGGAGYYATTWTAGAGYTIDSGTGCGSASRTCAQYQIFSSTQSGITASFTVSGGGGTTYHDITVDNFKQ